MRILKNRYSKSLREEIVHVYLTGDNSYEELSKQYNVPLSNIRTWVWRYRKSKKVVSLQPEAIKTEDMARKKSLSPMDENEALRRRVKELEERLRFSELQNLALNTMIDIAEEQGIDIRKKSGAKQ
jgi:transposase-like protein